MDNDRRKIDHDLHEMGKSFARSAEDEDMNEKLKVLNLEIIIEERNACPKNMRLSKVFKKKVNLKYFLGGRASRGPYVSLYAK